MITDSWIAREARRLGAMSSFQARSGGWAKMGRIRALRGVDRKLEALGADSLERIRILNRIREKISGRRAA